MFVRNRCEIYTSSLPNKDGKMVRFHDLGGEGGGGGFAVSFFMILSKIVAPWGLPINLRIFWLKISMPGSADEISQNNR